MIGASQGLPSRMRCTVLCVRLRAGTDVEHSTGNDLNSIALSQVIRSEYVPFGLFSTEAFSHSSSPTSNTLKTFMADAGSGHV